MIIVGIFAIAFGLFFGFYLQKDNKPIPREEAVFFSGEFEEYETWDSKSRTICFKDGSYYEVYPYTEKQEFYDKMTALPKGTMLYLAINPNNGYVIEIKTETEELLNFDESQAALDSYDNFYTAIGIFVCFAGVFFIVDAFFLAKHKKKEAVRHEKKKKRNVEGMDDVAIRRADRTAKCRILLEATVEGYRICYRRVKSVNELVINGTVYDDFQGVVEFEHSLTATLDGHEFEAGFDEDSFSYIEFDGERIAQKRRWI